MTKLKWIATVLLFTFCVSSTLILLKSTRAYSASLNGASVTRQDSFIELSLSFDNVPEFTLRELNNPPRLELILMKTSLASEKMPADLTLPILKLAPFSGGENISLSIHLVGKVPYLLKRRERNLSILFPTTFNETSTILLSGSILLNLERSFDGKRFTELYYTKLSPEQVGRHLRMISSADLGAKGLTVSEIAERTGSTLAFNAGFFDEKGNPVGLLIVDGRLLALPAKGKRASLIVDGEGMARILRPNLSFWLEVDGKRIRVDGFNQPMTSGKVLLYNHLYPREKLTKEAIYFKLTGDELCPISFEDLANLEGDAIILAETLSPEADPFKGKAKIAFRFSITDELGKEVRARNAVEGSPMLVENGVVSINTAIDEISAQVAEGNRARTAVGIDKEGGLIFLVVKENRELGVRGMSLKEVAEKLVQLGAVWALNLDGGGSSEVVIVGVPLNLKKGAERKVPSALVVY